MFINLLNPLMTGVASSDITDEDCVQRYLETQNVSYFNLLYRRYSSKVYAKCISILKDEFKAEDATQEIFTKILLNLSKFAGKSKFSTWLYSVTYNFCIDMVRRIKKDIGILVDDIGHYGDEMIEEVDDKELLEMNVLRLKEVLDNINVGDKAILLMKYQDEMSIREIGSILDKSESAIKMKIKRAKEKAVNMYKELYPEY